MWSLEFGGELCLNTVYGDVVAIEPRGGERIVNVLDRKKDHTVGVQIREADMVSWGIYVNTIGWAEGPNTITKLR
jgi:hypothetical protein